MSAVIKTQTGEQLRDLARSGAFTGTTAGQAPDYLQGNMVVLPRSLANDFLLYCTNNPKPCPLIGLSEPGDPRIPALGHALDVRTDLPLYRIYRNGEFTEEVNDISAHWADDSVAFVLGCSFSFEDSLLREGYAIHHIERGCNVPMFKTNIPTTPGGRFSGPLVVSMRSYPSEQIPHVFDICEGYRQAHGAPVYWGTPSAIGIDDIMKPDYGDAVPVPDDEIPVFWACGVTPQAAIEQTKPEFCITHAPGSMLVTDVPASQPALVNLSMRAIMGA